MPPPFPAFLLHFYSFSRFSAAAGIYEMTSSFEFKIPRASIPVARKIPFFPAQCMMPRDLFKQFLREELTFRRLQFTPKSAGIISYSTAPTT
jgi:hypothetical protein